MSALFAALACLSIVLLLWQWLAARRFPLHQTAEDPPFAPPLTLLKPLKGVDDASENCLRSWFDQNYAGPVQILFATASADDPACALVNKLLREYPGRDAQLIVCERLAGTNAKASKLARLEQLARHDVLIASDADVRVPKHFLASAVAPFRDPDSKSIGVVTCFYQLANPSTLAMHWEAIAINADFWSQVLQSRDLKPLDFALGAVMVSRRAALADIGGFAALQDCLADDYQLGHRLAKKGYRIALSPVAVECWDPPMNWTAVWRHQLRWARTIRVCQPVPYFFSILSNATLWPLLWLVVQRGESGLPLFLSALGLRMFAAVDLQWCLTQSWRHVRFLWLAPIKDMLQAAVWAAAFCGNRIEWRGNVYRLRRDGTLEGRPSAAPR